MQTLRWLGDKFLHYNWHGLFLKFYDENVIVKKKKHTNTQNATIYVIIKFSAFSVNNWDLEHYRNETYWEMD